MSANVQPQPVKSTHWMRRISIYAILLMAVFLLGFIPMWLKARDSASRLLEAQRHLNLARVQNALASAAVDTR